MEAISTFDIFKVGVGPSSSHTLGPWRAAQRFLARCRERGVLGRLTRVRVDLYGSLAKTGRGHGTDLAVLLGLAGEDPVTCDTSSLPARAAAFAAAGRIPLEGVHEAAVDLAFHYLTALPFHANALAFVGYGGAEPVVREVYYSVGGGFVVQEGEPADATHAVTLPLPVETAADLLRHCREQGLDVAGVVRRNERAWRTDAAVADGLATLWRTMRACVHRGCVTEGTLPGGLNVVRRAAGLCRSLLGGRTTQFAGPADEAAWAEAVRAARGGFTETLGWVSCFALAVNEENAAFGRVVTAPTNGAAGVIPAVLLYLERFCRPDDVRAVEDFLLAAGAVGVLFKKGATLSAAMGGCQAEIGVSSAMAAAGLTQAQGGSPGQVLMAAEIAMEHHLGLTCDPVGGLVQVPCIERNAMGAVKALTACQLALAGDPARARVSLDAVVKTMWATAQDMHTKYKETAEGGLAVQIPVSVSEC